MLSREELAILDHDLLTFFDTDTHPDPETSPLAAEGEAYLNQESILDNPIPNPTLREAIEKLKKIEVGSVRIRHIVLSLEELDTLNEGDGELQYTLRKLFENKHLLINDMQQEEIITLERHDPLVQKILLQLNLPISTPSTQVFLEETITLFKSFIDNEAIFDDDNYIYLDRNDPLLHSLIAKLKKLEDNLIVNARQKEVIEVLRSQFLDLAKEEQIPTDSSQEAIHFAEKVLTTHWPLNDIDDETHRYVDPITAEEISAFSLPVAGYLLDVRSIHTNYNTQAHIVPPRIQRPHRELDAMTLAQHFSQLLREAEATGNPIENCLTRQPFTFRDTISIIQKGLEVGLIFSNLDPAILKFGLEYFQHLAGIRPTQVIEEGLPLSFQSNRRQHLQHRTMIEEAPHASPYRRATVRTPVFHPAPEVTMTITDIHEHTISSRRDARPAQGLPSRERTFGRTTGFGFFPIVERPQPSLPTSTEDPLFAAARRGDIRRMHPLLTNRTVNIHRNGTSLLHVAIEHGHADIVSELRRWHIQLNAQDLDGNTPLHVAIKYHRDRICMDLLNNNPPPNLDLQNNERLNVIEYARRYHPDIVDSLNRYINQSFRQNSHRR